MKLRTRTLIVAPLVALVIASVNRSAIARSSVTCTMSFGGPEFSRSTLVGLGTALQESALAPGGADVAPGTPATGRRLRPPLARRFLLSDVPREIAEPHRAALKKSSGHVCVVSWSRNAACALESGDLGDSERKHPHAVLFLTPRPWNLWVNGEPTYDAFNGRFGSGTLWEAGAKSENPISLRDLRIFLAVYPRLAGFTKWREGSFLNWALAHRDSGNTRALKADSKGS